jgi:hypothetical protein
MTFRDIDVGDLGERALDARQIGGVVDHLDRIVLPQGQHIVAAQSPDADVIAGDGLSPQ